MQTVHFTTLGCPSNLADTYAMGQVLEAQGWAKAACASTAQLIVVNTCSLTGDAQQVAVDTILALAEHKHDGACQVLAVAGCLSQRHGPDLQEALPEVDIFVGTGDWRSLARRVAGVLALAGLPQPIARTSDKPYRLVPSRARARGPASVAVALTRGCSNPCSFCVVPNLQGPSRSVPLAEIVAQAEGHMRAGAVELTFTSHDVGRWGEDLRPITNFAELIGALDAAAAAFCAASNTAAVWLRFTAAHPDHLTSAAIAAWGRARHVLPYVDLPLQHIDADLLQRMGRAPGPEGIRAQIAALRAQIPNLSLGTTLMVGFPGETPQAFATLMDFVAETRFERLTVVAFDPQDGTQAAALANPVDAEVTKLRMAQLQALQADISLDAHEAQVGDVIDVLVEGPSPQTPLLWQGRHMGQCVPDDGITYITEGTARPGEVVQVRIDAAHAQDLAGAIVAAAEANHANAMAQRNPRKALSL